MEIIFTFKAKEDIDFWKKSGNTNVLKKIKKLLEIVRETSFEGIGKP